MKHYFLILLSLGVLVGCNNQEAKKADEAITEEAHQKDEKESHAKRKFPNSKEKGKFFERDGKKMLYGGKDESQHFELSSHILKEENYHYGIGREAFPALLEPEFISIKEADTLWDDDARFLVAYAGNDVKAYSVK
ncbi:MAG: hypothetical protein JKZ03_00360, partial [Flavobacteriaceae bacterium]|nr:hypothetical protein [Flavobacteriaceae bacterium]